MKYSVPGLDRAIGIFAVALLVLCASAPTGAAETSPQASAPPLDKRVLILVTSGVGDFQLFDKFTARLFAGLTNGGIDGQKIHVEYLDLFRHPQGEYRQQLAALLMRKYARQKIDLVFCLAQPALNFLLEEGRGLAPGAASLSWFARLPSAADIGQQRFVVQMPKANLSGTLQLALKLFPRTERVVMLQGSSESDLRSRNTFESQLAAWQGKLQFEDTQGLSIEEIEARLSALPENTIVLDTPILRDASGKLLAPFDVIKRVVGSSNAPVFALYDTHVGLGTIGGNVIQFETEADASVMQAIDILRKSNQRATIHEVSYTPMFDWRQLERWGADPGVLPSNTLFLNKPPTLWQQYRATVISAMVALAMLTGMVVWLLRLNRRLVQSKRAARDGEARFVRAVEGANDGIWELVCEIDELYWSPRLKQLLGYEQHELPNGKAAFVDRVHADDLPLMLETVRAHLEERKPYGVELRMRCKNGEYRWFYVRGKASRDEQGLPQYISGSTSDITPRKREEERLDAFLKNSAVIAWLKDEDNRYVYISDNCLKLFGLARDAVIGKTDHDLMPKELADQTAGDDLDLLAQGGTREYEREVTAYQGEASWWLLNKCIISSHDGKRLVGGLAVCITEIKRSEQERFARELAHRNALVREVHHRIKNNLQSVSGLLHRELGRLAALDPILKTAIGQVNAIAQVHGLQGSNPGEEIVLSQVLQSICKSIGDMFQLPVLFQSGDADGTSRSMELVKEEAVSIALVLNELILNAIKHSPQGSPAPVVTMTTDQGGAQIVIRNALAGAPDFDIDTGKGIGTGLGLVRSLLPQEGAKLHFALDAEGFMLSRLRLTSPVIAAARPKTANRM